MAYGSEVAQILVSFVLTRNAPREQILIKIGMKQYK